MALSSQRRSMARTNNSGSATTPDRQLAPAKTYLKISEVAAQVGVSPSVIRIWEKLGLSRPRRSDSLYRLYTPDDVKLLKTAAFLRKVRHMNAPAILEYLKSHGMLRRNGNGNGAEQDAAVGSRLRMMRSIRGLSLSAVARAVGISTGFLSAIERSQMSASVGTLRKLARYYRVSILDFYNPPEANPHLVRPRERKVMQAGPGVTMELLAWGKTVMEPHLFRVAAGSGSGDPYTHEGEEFLFLVKGELDISLDGQSYRLRAGDSFYFESTTPHRWSNPGRKETWVLWINTPPTF
jgi:DNA-binding transcriptional MerR regulator/mannose-6-phosphate isomerase-like protein (cupin superfamily)